jgi:hypothetical protein
MVTEVEAADTAVPVRFSQRLFSFPVMLAGLLSLLAILTVRGRFADPDMWWHLKMGQIMWTTHMIPKTDIFSFTASGHTYVPHEWLAQLSIFCAFRLGGYTGLMLWLCIFSSAIVIAGYLLCSIYSGNAKIAFIGAMTIWVFATIGFAIRPQMIGYLFLILELLFLHLGRNRSPRWFLGLPPIFAVWVNTHGSFFLGLAVAGVILCSSLFSFRMGLLVAPRWDRRFQRALALAIALSVAALFLNPTGLRQVLYPIDTFLHQPVGLSQVEEWQKLGFSDSRAFVLLLVLLGPFVIAVVRKNELLLQELLLLGLGSLLAASHQRMLFVFGILAAPTLSRMLAGEWDSYDMTRDRTLVNSAFLVASLFAIFMAFPRRGTLEKEVELQSPAKAVAFLNRNHLSGQMLNEYVYGGYLIWGAPQYPVFIDGRGDVFDATGVFAEYMDWIQLRSDPKELLNKYRIDFCLLARQSPMVRVLSLLQWKMVYSDENSAILVRSEAVQGR